MRFWQPQGSRGIALVRGSAFALAFLTLSWCMAQNAGVEAPADAPPARDELLLPLPPEPTEVIRPVSAAPAAVRELVASDNFLDEWDPAEYQLLSAEGSGTTDVLAALPQGSVTVPAKPLTIEELLSANRPEEPITYSPAAVSAVNTAVGSRNPFRALRVSGTRAGELPAGNIQIESPDYLDYDDEHHMIYGHGRITARYGIYKLQADRMMVDTRLREIQAYGNVIMTSDIDYIEAESMWVDTMHNQGVAYNTRGRTGPFFFLADPECDNGRTTFRQLSQQEALLKEASFTTCDFPVPHYRLHAREFTIMFGDRIFARNVVLYVMECPVLWLPYLTRSLADKNPWGLTLGSDGKLGFYVRLWYDFYHSCYTPSDVDDSIMVTSSRGHARLHTDWFSDRGFGKGLEYSYNFNYGQHRGDLFAYQISDSERDVRDEADSSDRYYLNWFHRTKISSELQWMVDADYPSDPDIFYDILDRVRSSSERRRDRLPERRVQTGFEWTTDDFFAGLQVEIKDRIGRDRVSNFAEPSDGDWDFDRRYNTEEMMTLFEDDVPLGPYVLPGTYTNPASLEDDLDNGVSRNRYGRVTERLPQLTVSSNRLRLWCLPLWYHVDLNVYNNLDKGLNIVNDEDDSFVRGFDLYQSMSHLLKFCERYTLLTKVGLGIGIADREDDSYNLDFPDGTTFPWVYDGQVIGTQGRGLTFVDEETFLVGERERSLRDVEPTFVYGDIDSRFNARISDCLTAWIRYRLREGTDDSLGEFYESIGSRKTQDDLYAFRTPEHWIEAGVSYNLLRPRLNVNASAGRNLQGEDDIYPHELLQYYNLGVGWANLCNTVLLNAGISLQDRQMRDPTDPFEYEQNSIVYYLGGTIMPVHQRWWARFNGTFIQNAEDDPLNTNNDFHDNDDDWDTLDDENIAVADFTLGRKIGSKYLVELRSRLRTDDDGSGDHWVRVERDFHDVIAGVSVGVKSEELSEDEEREEENNLEFRMHVKFKPSHQKGVLPNVRAADLYSAGKLGAFETGG